MLSTLIFLPLLGGLLVLAIPRSRPHVIGTIATAVALGTLALSLSLLRIFSAAPESPAVIAEHASWIPSIGAEYALVCDGISLPLVLLTTLLTLVCVVYSSYSPERQVSETAKEYFFLFLVMETGLLGTFLAADLLLFYLFWEVALVPLYFIIGIWGHERRREAALKFFLYTRAGSLALLLAILGLYLNTNPRSFALGSIVNTSAANSLTALAGFALLGFTIGFGVKLPIIPLHSWLPDAHVEAPTAGSVILAGVLLKMGGYGFIRITLPSVHAAFSHYGPVLAGVAAFGIVYAAAVALAQRDFKRMVAFTSINHMGFVLLGTTVAAVSASDSIRLLAINGAVLQMVSHGLLTGGMFLLVGMLQQRTGTRDLEKLGGMWKALPAYAVLLTAFSFGSFGLPSLSGFVAEFQVFVASLSVYVWGTVIAAIGVAISTALYLRALQRVAFGHNPDTVKQVRRLTRIEAGVLALLLASSFFIGLYPRPFIGMIESGAHRILPR